MASTYIIRLDDACPTMGEGWDRLEDIFDRYGIRPIVAVIPNNKDPELFFQSSNDEFWNRVRMWQNKGWMIAMHGYEHLFVTQQGGLIPINDRSEFTGLSLPEQQEKIRNAYEYFIQEGIRPLAWIAPAHSFDQYTLEALRCETPIRVISDGIALRPFKKKGFVWLPQQLWRLRNCWWGGVYTVCLHPNTMTTTALKDLEHLIARYRKRIVDPHSFISTKRNLDLLDRLFAFVWWQVYLYAKK